jgi:hypothetical protein
MAISVAMRRRAARCVCAGALVSTILGCAEPAPVKHLDVSIRASATELMVTNDSPDAWRSGHIWLTEQSSLGPSPYKLEMGKIDAHGTKIFQLHDFADGDGRRFDPFALKLHLLLVSAETASGHAEATLSQ